MPTDGPYHGVKKGHGWDNEHKSDVAFLDWKRERYAAWKRILAPNGTLYDFAAAKIGSRVEIVCSEVFSVIARITWAKTLKHTPAHYKIRKESLRTYFPNTETIVVAEQRGSDSIALGESQYGAECYNLRGFIFEPLRAYLDDERERAGFKRSQVHETWCAARGTKGNMVSHWFGAVQWMLPTLENYEWLRSVLNVNGSDLLAKPYEELRLQYEELRMQYEELRRPFNVTAQDQYTDVWNYTTVKPYEGKHPCEKPEDMARDIVRISSRPNDVVLVFFAGSGIFASEALKQGRRAIAVEMDPHWADVTHRRCIAAIESQ